MSSKNPLCYSLDGVIACNRFVIKFDLEVNIYLKFSLLSILYLNFFRNEVPLIVTTSGEAL